LIDHGTLPHAGGKLDQDPRFIEAVALIDAVAHKVSEADGKKSK